MGSRDTLRVNTSLMYFEWGGKVSVSDSDSVLNSGTEPIIRFRFTSPVSIMGMGIGSRLRFSVSSMDLDADEF